MKKRYWLRGGVIGIVIYFLFILVAVILSNEDKIANNPAGDYLGAWLIGIFSLPSIPLGFLLGWLYGKFKNRNQEIQQG